MPTMALPRRQFLAAPVFHSSGLHVICRRHYFPQAVRMILITGLYVTCAFHRYSHPQSHPTILRHWLLASHQWQSLTSTVIINTNDTTPSPSHHYSRLPDQHIIACVSPFVSKRLRNSKICCRSVHEQHGCDVIIAFRFPVIDLPTHRPYGQAQAQVDTHIVHPYSNPTKLWRVTVKI